MSQVKRAESFGAERADPRWKDLYTIGGIACIAGVIVTIAAVIAFFIWPYQPGFKSTIDVFAALQQDRLGGLMALDFFFIVGTLVSIFPMLALYAALKRVNESYALIALALGIIAVAALIPARPIAELVFLSDRYAAATTDAARSQYRAAGESLLALFNGTAWLVNIVFASVSSLISSVLMLRSAIFSKATAYVGIIVSIGVLCFFIPVIGMYLIFLATMGGAVFYILVGRRLLQLGRQPALSGATAGT